MPVSWDEAFANLTMPQLAGAGAGAAFLLALSDMASSGQIRTLDTPTRSGAEQQFLQERQAALGQLLGQVPTAEQRMAVAQQQIGEEMSQAGQSLVANAAARGLLTSGILQAQKQKLARQAQLGLAQARLQSEMGPQLDRARILQQIAAEQPLPEVTIRQGESGFLPLATGLAGAGIGGALGGPAGAGLGYQLGHGLGQAAGSGGAATATARRRGY